MTAANNGLDDMLVVGSTSEIKDIIVAPREDGTMIWVSDTRKAYRLLKFGFLPGTLFTVDGVSIVQPSAGAPIAGAPGALWVDESLLNGTVPSSYFDALTTPFLRTGTGGSSPGFGTIAQVTFSLPISFPDTRLLISSSVDGAMNKVISSILTAEVDIQLDGVTIRGARIDNIPSDPPHNQKFGVALVTRANFPVSQLATGMHTVTLRGQLAAGGATDTFTITPATPMAGSLEHGTLSVQVVRGP